MPQTILNIELPDSAVRALKVPKDRLTQFVRHTLAVELYREGKLSLGKAKELAGLVNKWEMIQLLNERGVDLNYTEQDIKLDKATLNRLFP